MVPVFLYSLYLTLYKLDIPLRRTLKAGSKGVRLNCWPTTPNIVGSYMLRPFAHPVVCCCAKFETGQTISYVKTDATTPNIVGPTMLGIVASVFTQR